MITDFYLIYKLAAPRKPLVLMATPRRHFYVDFFMVVLLSICLRSACIVATCIALLSAVL